ncbi:DsbA family protein [Methylovulum sp.]|uniref:DsbA family protein n=1 Tax=Methylovulum sp. TaxID=1916980 RepID=UPI00260E2CE8|nr:DsbA family protein [Methylovulum sp.]MDD5125541.1 DsbA family protein [Methylovulum sp.]
MNLFVRVILFFAWSLAASASQAEEKWVADELFLQLADMRKAVQQLQQKVSVLEQQLADRQPKLAAIDLAGSERMTLGKPGAAIAILEFSDYECPYCAKHYKNVLPKLRERYIDKGMVKYVMKDFPLDFHAHAHAKKASLSARCAGEQGHYWAMHKAIFEARGQVTDQLTDSVIRQEKLDASVFKRCLDNPAQLAAIEQDRALGARVGISGTPAFLVGTVKGKQLINYQRFDGVQSFETFADMIERVNKQ